MEIRVTCTVPGAGTIENVERVQEAFGELYPDVGPVAEANLAEATLAITFAIDAVDLEEFAETAADVFSAGWTRSGVPFESISVEISLPDAADQLARELQPA